MAGKNQGLSIQRYDGKRLVQGKWNNETDLLRMGKHCLQRVSNNKENSTNAIIKVIPEELSTGEMTQKPEEATAPAELVIRCGCVSMDISPEMSVTKIAELVSALNSHV